MRNAIISSVSSQLCSISNGNNDFRMLNMDLLTQIDNNFGFCMESRLFNNDNQLIGGGFTVPHHRLIGYKPDVAFQANNLSSFDREISQHSVLLPKKTSVPHSEPLHAIQNGRKHMLKDNYSSLTQKGSSNVIGNKTELNRPPWKSNKKIKATSFEDPLQQIVNHNHNFSERLHVPVRRSQKLGDKITALQKLVSPYGKTDTASVLQEACLYIKLLQDQIKMLSRSYNYNSVRSLHPQQETGKEAVDLRSRGLCLVPVSLTGKVTMDPDRVDCLADASPRNFVTPRNL